MKRLYIILLSAFALLATHRMSAASITIEGITYTTDENNEAYVSQAKSTVSNASILPWVAIDGTTYPVTSIGSRAFYMSRSLTSVTIPNSVTSIGNYAFDACIDLTRVEISDLAAWCNIQFGNYYSNPLYSAHHLYLNGTEVKDLVIPESVTSIGNYAFSEFSGLTSLTICNSVTSIGDYAFSYCYSLKSVTIGNSVTSIGAYAFYDCKGLTSVTIPDSVTSIGSDAFGGCSGLSRVEISDLAAWCKIQFADVWSNPLDFAHHLYLNGTEVTDLVTPESVTSIGNFAFIGCTGLTTVTIPNSVTSIGEHAFMGCRGLTTVTIPNSVTSIGSGAFSECSRLKSVTIPNSVTSIGDFAFSFCSGLTSLTIPNSVTSIGLAAFQACSGLTSITIPNSVTSIGDYAFNGCSGLAGVKIGKSVTSIGEGAFYSCSALNRVDCYAVNPPTASDSFFEYKYIMNSTLHVPQGSLKAYQSSPYWGYFGTIIDDLDPDGLNGVTDVTTDDSERLVDVYTTSGIRLMHQVKRDAVNTLPAGLYIVDGKKLLIH